MTGKEPNMVMRLQPQNRKALTATNDALRAVDRYMKGRLTKDIDEADKMIGVAVNEDAEYALAVLCRGIVHDLRGTPADAIEHFQRIVDETTDKNLQRQAHFGLGVACYHQYSHQWLQRAEDHLRPIVNQEEDPDLALHATAILAQVHAMWIRPSGKQAPDTESVRQHMVTHYKECAELVKSLGDLRRLPTFVAAPAYNALGMAHMYITDYFETGESEKREHLSRAVNDLKRAADLFPRDWANTCDLGSVALRQGVLHQSRGETADAESCFERAKAHLISVTEMLRPGYGFAYYELGILHRVWGKWEEAEKYQHQALGVPERYRDISEYGVKHQLALIAKRDSSYPGPRS